MTKFSNISSILLIAANIPLGYLTIQALANHGGDMGLGYLVVYLNLLAHFFLIPAIINLFLKGSVAKKVFFGINTLGLIIALLVGSVLLG